jgi:hypothetical protein
MPVGSPGMEIDGMAPEAYDVIAFEKNGETSIFTSYAAGEDQ